MLEAQTVIAIALALATGLLPALLLQRWTLWHGLAASAILYPAINNLLGFIQIAPLILEPTVLPPLTPEQLARIPWRITRNLLTVPTLGLTLLALLGAGTLVRKHLRALYPSHDAFKQDLTIGWALVPIILITEAIALILLAGPAAFIQTGDESARFAHATWQHVLMLTLVPALVEEAYYRGLLQGVLENLLPHRIALHGAILLQATIFGLSHGGYGTLSHILGPLLFGLAMGYLRTYSGIGACIVLHAAVNLLYFSLDPGAGSPELLIAAALTGITGLIALLVMRNTLFARLQAGPRRIHA